MSDKKTMVTLSTPTLKDKESKAVKKQEFEISHANRLLNLPKTQWKLDDPKFSWNGKEIATATSTKKD